MDFPSHEVVPLPSGFWSSPQMLLFLESGESLPITYGQVMHLVKSTDFKSLTHIDFTWRALNAHFARKAMDSIMLELFMLPKT